MQLIKETSSPAEFDVDITVQGAFEYIVRMLEIPIELEGAGWTLTKSAHAYTDASDYGHTLTPTAGGVAEATCSPS